MANKTVVNGEVVTETRTDITDELKEYIRKRKIQEDRIKQLNNDLDVYNSDITQANIDDLTNEEYQFLASLSEYSFSTRFTAPPQEETTEEPTT